MAALCDAALPGEALSADELLAVCWEGDDRAAVLGYADGSGAVVVCVQDHGTHDVGFVKLIAVDPRQRRQGRGRALLDAAHAWMFDENGATEARVGASAPHYLWPGVDTAHLEALCLFESAGYFVTGAELNMRCSTTWRSATPDGVTIARVIDDAQVEAVGNLVQTQWPWWAAESARAIEHGCCHVAFDANGEAVGFACHSVNRAGWVGPMGTDPARQHGGVGAALLSQLCCDLQVAGFDDAEIAWVGPVGFYAKTAAATVSRTFRSLSRRAPRH